MVQMAKGHLLASTTVPSCSALLQTGWVPAYLHGLRASLALAIWKTCTEGGPQESLLMDFPGGAVVKNPPANTGDTGLNPGRGRSHMLWNN